MEKYRTKPIKVEAWKFTSIDCVDCPKWVHDLLDNHDLCRVDDDRITIMSDYGASAAIKGDYIIKHNEYEFEVCTPEVFLETYEKVEE